MAVLGLFKEHACQEAHPCRAQPQPHPVDPRQVKSLEPRYVCMTVFLLSHLAAGIAEYCAPDQLLQERAGVLRAWMRASSVILST